MKVYLDDDSADALLVTLLRQAGHDVQVPADVGMTGEYDSVHLIQAVRDGRVLLTHNHDDFQNLHELIMQVQGHYPGVFVVRRDNDPTRDLKPAGMVRAIRSLLAAGVAVRDQLHILNQWR
jgi:predicted nuclease of predicted toxin-antitoxin system